MVKSRVLWAIGIVVACGNPGVLSGQTPQIPSFEVASVKPNKSGELSGAAPRAQGDRVTATNVPLRLFIQVAYNIGADRLIGAPDWINSDRFDLVAKAEAPLSGNQWQLMLRTLLADRFKLAVHTETRPEPIWALLIARRDDQLGPSLRRATTDCATLRAAAPSGENDPCGLRTASMAALTGRMRVRGLGIDQLAGFLARDAGREVVDKTGLTGIFDWNLTFTPQTFLRGPFDRERYPSIDPDGPSIFAAVQEQLGLKLSSEKGQGDVLVIDRVEHPTED